MARRILVSGCAGYIGSMLCKSLLERGFKVRGVDNLMYKNGYALNGLICSNFEFVHLSVCDSRFPALAKDCDWVYHTAARVGAPICDRDKDKAIEVNQIATENLVKNLDGYQKIIFLTTNSGYGKSKEWCTEESPLNPLSVYGTSKVNAEKAVLNYKNSISLRLATVFGASWRPRMDLLVNDWTAKLLLDKKLEIYESHFRRNFVGINDVVRCCIHMMDSQYQGVYNVGNPQANLTKLQLADTIVNELDNNAVVSEGTGKDPDARDYLISNQKLLNTRFEFKQSLRDGIQDVKNLCKIHGYEVFKYGNV